VSLCFLFGVSFCSRDVDEEGGRVRRPGGIVYFCMGGSVRCCVERGG